MQTAKLFFSGILFGITILVMHTPSPSCAEQTSPTMPGSRSVIIQSHRGAGELLPENTMDAFKLGWELNTWPEADVRTTSDGVLIAFHDKNFQRLVKPTPFHLEGKSPADLNWADLSKLDVGSWMDQQYAELRIPRIADVFQQMQGAPDRHLYLDIKDAKMTELAALVRQYGIEKQVVLATPHHELIREWKDLVPESETLLWMGGKEADIAKKLERAREAQFQGITQIQFHVHLNRPADEIRRDTPDPFSPTDKFIRNGAQELQNRGILLQVFPWHGNTRDIYWKLLDLGVGAFATDHPRVTLDAIQAYSKK